jgi:geranylgeranyl diphosphate synthase type I
VSQSFQYPFESSDFSDLRLAVDALRGDIDKALQAFLTRERQLLVSIDEELLPVADSLSRYLINGGKRFRPLFAAAGLIGSGGALDQASINAIATLELVHACALIHDDVMDGSDTRRGAPAIHREFESKHRDRKLSGSSENFGVASAILLGDLALVWANKLLTESGISNQAYKRTSPLFDLMKVELMAGQYLDVLEQTMKSERVERALKVATYKSGKYSVERPIHFGSLLGSGANLESYTEFGIPLGQAFQLRDDLLGVFGDSVETGKPSGDDLREGKRTALVALAVENISDLDRFNALFGKPDISSAEITEVQKMIEMSGAPAKIETMIADLTTKALAALDDDAITTEGKNILRFLAQLATARKK